MLRKFFARVLEGFRSARSGQRFLGLRGVALSVLLALAVSVPVSLLVGWRLHETPPAARINVRWNIEVRESERAQLEAQLGLVDGVFREGSTWSYEVPEPTRSVLEAIVRHEKVDDTHGVDRERYVLGDAPPTKIGAIVALAASVFPLFFLPSFAAIALMVVVTSQPMSAAAADVERSTTLVAFGSALPTLVGLSAVALYGVGAVLGTLLFGPPEPLNLAEAAALRETALVYRLTWDGADLDRREPLRAELSGLDRPVDATPLEAAAANGQAEIVSLLLRLGAALDEDHYGRVFCLARQHERSEVIAAIEEIGTSQAWEPDCDALGSIW